MSKTECGKQALSTLPVFESRERVNEQITISKRQYRMLCDAYINTVNMMPQLLMITPNQDDRSPDALHRLQTTLQLVEGQLKEVKGNG